jgi:nitrogen fixation-related uncharacterized protein
VDEAQVIYVLIGYAVLVLAALVLVLRWGMKAKDAEVMAGKICLDTQRICDEMQRQRDDWKVRHDTKEAELARERVLRITAEKQRNEAMSKERERAVESIKSGGIDNAVRVATAVVSAPLPKVPRPAAPSGAAGFGGVQPAGPPRVDPLQDLK